MDFGMDALQAFDDAVRKMRGTGELSDEAVLSVRRRFGLIEKRPAPRELSSSQVEKFLDEHEVGVSWKPASKQTLRVVTLTSDAFPTTKGNTLREAVCRAVAKFEEINS